jgi:hypothetical protein
MGKVIIIVSMSLDGFVASPNSRVAAPLGDGAVTHGAFRVIPSRG